MRLRFAAIAAALLACAAQADAPGPGYDAIRFDEELTPDFAAKTIIGETRLTFRSLVRVGVCGTRTHLCDWYLELSRPYSSYLFGFAAGYFDHWETRAGNNRIFTFGRDIAPTQLAARFGTTPAMVAFFEEKAGVPLPNGGYAQLYVAGSEAQEAAAFSIIGEEEIGPILTDPAEDWAIAHELAHQWWGNLITCASWDEFWLNEGITTFMTAAWKEHAFGRAAYDREMVLARKRVQKAKDKGVDAKLTFTGPYPSLGLKRAIVYSKGALFMDALRSELGDDIFWRAFKAYTQAHVGGAVTSRDFQLAFEAEAGRSLQRLFDQWVY